jgi:hypothetical protein
MPYIEPPPLSLVWFSQCCMCKQNSLLHSQDHCVLGNNGCPESHLVTDLQSSW